MHCLIQLIIILFMLSCAVPQGSGRTGIRPANQTARFFDLDKSGTLSTYEYNLLKTHQHFGWPLANSKLKKEFDFNQDGMLEPQELEKYEEERKKRAVRIRPSRSYAK